MPAFLPCGVMRHMPEHLLGPYGPTGGPIDIRENVDVLGWGNFECKPQHASSAAGPARAATLWQLHHCFPNDHQVYVAACKRKAPGAHPGAGLCVSMAGGDPHALLLPRLFGVLTCSEPPRNRTWNLLITSQLCQFQTRTPRSVRGVRVFLTLVPVPAGGRHWLPQS